MIEPHVHVIAALAVLSRIADVWTTYLATPTLRLEGNLLARRLGWPYALATILLGLVAYVSPGLGIVVLTASFLVAAANASKIVMARALGEEQMAVLLDRVARATRPWPGLMYIVLPGILTAALGATMFIFYHDSAQWGFYFALGTMSHASAVFLWYPLRYFRGRLRSRRRSDQSSREEDARTVTRAMMVEMTDRVGVRKGRRDHEQALGCFRTGALLHVGPGHGGMHRSDR
jgi:hypothetical protein